MTSIALRIGEEYSLELPGKSTAGYEWESDLRGDSCVRIKKYFKADASDRLGDNASEVFTIRALAAGQCNILFELRRPWETDTKPLQEAFLEVQVM